MFKVSVVLPPPAPRACPPRHEENQAHATTTEVSERKNHARNKGKELGRARRVRARTHGTPLFERVESLLCRRAISLILFLGDGLALAWPGFKMENGKKGTRRRGGEEEEEKEGKGNIG